MSDSQVDIVAQMIADAIGHRMAEKCEPLAERIVTALTAGASGGEWVPTESGGYLMWNGWRLFRYDEHGVHAAQPMPDGTMRVLCLYDDQHDNEFHGMLYALVSAILATTPASPAAVDGGPQCKVTRGAGCEYPNCDCPTPQPAAAQGGMTFAFMAEVCDAAVQAMQVNGLANRTFRLQEVRDLLRLLAASHQPQGVEIGVDGRMTATAAPQPQEAPAQLHGHKDPRPCYVCGQRADAHPMVPGPRGGMKRGECPATPPARGDGEMWFTLDDVRPADGKKIFGRSKSGAVWQEEFDRNEPVGSMIEWRPDGWTLTTRPTPEAQEARDCTCPSGDGSLRWPCPEHPTEDANVAAVQRKLGERSVVGLCKYGVSTERGDLSGTDWLRHLQEELMDAAVYVEAAMAARGEGES